MKHIAYYFLAACALMLCGCSADGDEQTTENYDDGRTLHTVPMAFYGGPHSTAAHVP